MQVLRQSNFILSVIISKAVSEVYEGQVKKVQRQVNKQRQEGFLNLTKKSFKIRRLQALL